MERRVTLHSEGGLSGKVRVPPSKSYTHRAVITASLSEGQSRVQNPLVSRDTLATFRACRAMGAHIEESDSLLTIEGAVPGVPDSVVDVDNSGTTLRLMTSVFALPEKGYTVLTGDASIRRRPMQGLIDALSGLGVSIRSSKGDGLAPIIVGEGGIRGGDVSIRGDVSSQFVSSVLISAPLAREGTRLRVADAVSRPYIDATLCLLGQHRVSYERDEYSNFSVEGRQEYAKSDFMVPGDFSSASFLLAATALAGGKVELTGLSSTLPQGDSAILGILERMGADVARGPDSVTIRADGDRLRGGSFEITDTPDLLPVLSVLALNCDGPTEISGVAHARFKESDRIGVTAHELAKLGVQVEEKPDGLLIRNGGSFRSSPLDAHGDHRMFIAFSLASLLLPEGIPITGVDSLDVSYPSFLSDIAQLGAKVVED